MCPVSFVLEPIERDPGWAGVGLLGLESMFAGSMFLHLGAV